MRVIKNGIRKQLVDKPKRYTCTDCDSVIEMKRAEMGCASSDRDGTYYTFKCPVCTHENYVDARAVEA